jgi:hypothetical protein
LIRKELFADAGQKQQLRPLQEEEDEGKDYYCMYLKGWNTASPQSISQSSLHGYAGFWPMVQ